MKASHFAPWSPSGTDLFDSKKAAHLLRRSGFGASPDEIARAVKDGLESTVESLFDEGEEDSKLFDQTFQAVGGFLSDFSDADVLRGWWVYRMVKTRVPLREKLTLFWHGHFATSVEKVEDIYLIDRQLDKVRKLAWGNFHDLVLTIAKDPAMIVYLDGESNTKAHPNENFGRELMELFTCGIGHYTEADVQATARAFTGWHREEKEFRFKADEHDDARKRFLGKSGRFDGTDIIDLLMQHPATPRRIATKLLRFFAAPEPSPDVIDEAAALLERTRLDIKWFLKDLFQSRYFYSPACYRTRISSPAEFVVGTVRTLGIRWAGQQLADQMNTMGQVLFAPPNVKGWDGENRWINSSTWAARTACGKAISQLESNSPHGANFDVKAIVPPSITEPLDVVDRLAEVLLQGELAPEPRKELAEFLLHVEEGQNAQAFREDEGVRTTQTRALVGLMLGLPEYHAC